VNATVHTTWTQPQIQALLAAVPKLLDGTQADPWGFVQGIQLRMGVALLSKIQQAFITKSRGGTGEDGIKWAPLKRETIAQRRTTAGERKALGIGRGNRYRGLLTRAEDERWRKIFAARKDWLMAKFGLSQQQASARAAQIAWSILKAEGAKTKLDLLGGRQVDILRDTGEMLRALSPGVDDKPSGADGQVFETPPGRVIVGLNKKPWHHTGIPGRLPARPLWPPDGNLPESWWEDITEAGRTGLIRALVLILSARHP
jgi:hypothetical protein